jgi:hypothetical protein
VGETLRFARSLYDPKSVAEAAKAYADLARIDVTEQGDDTCVTFADADADVAHVLADEFCNHVLLDTVARRQAAGARS